MSEKPAERDPGAGSPAEGYDKELGLRWILVFVAGIVALSVVSYAVMFPVNDRLKAARAAEDPAKSPMPEADVPRPRPRAALQVDPTADMVKFRAEEEKVLSEYAWVDEGAGIARIPVRRALDLVAEKGLPPSLRAPTGASAPTPTPPTPALDGGR